MRPEAQGWAGRVQKGVFRGLLVDGCAAAVPDFLLYRRSGHEGKRSDHTI
jgi:hypothetical protein